MDPAEHLDARRVDVPAGLLPHLALGGLGHRLRLGIAAGEAVRLFVDIPGDEHDLTIGHQAADPPRDLAGEVDGTELGGETYRSGRPLRVDDGRGSVLAQQSPGRIETDAVPWPQTYLAQPASSQARAAFAAHAVEPRDDGPSG